MRLKEFIFSKKLESKLVYSIFLMNLYCEQTVKEQSAI